jgi:hypothetical protein
VAQRNPATWAVVAIAAWRLLRNLYVSARAIVDLIVPVTVTGMLLSLRHNGPGPQEQEEALGRFPVGMHRFHQRHNKVRMRVVVDDGRSDDTRPWLVSMRDSDGVEVGQIVTVTGQRFGRHARRITRTSAQPSTAGRPVR